MFGKVLAAIGLVTAGQHTALVKRVDRLTHEARVWKKRADRATARMHQLEKQHQHQRTLLGDARRQSAELSAVDMQLTEAERAVAVVREHLMAIEVKLDILEGAANVLDARTRASVTPQKDATGAAVSQ